MVAQHSRKKKVALGVIITLVCVVVAVLIGFNLYIRIAYSSFYSKAQEEFAIPGVNNGFICQDLDYYDELQFERRSLAAVSSRCERRDGEVHR